MSSSSPEIVLISSPDGPIVAYEAATATPLATFNGSRSPRRGITVAGKTFIAVSHVCPVTASGSIHLYNWWASSKFQNISVPEPVAPLAATFDGFYLFSGGVSGSIHTFSLPSGDIISSLPAHRKPVSCLQLSEDGSVLISGGDDGAIVVIPIFQLVQAKANENTTKYILHKFSAHADSVTAIYSPSSSQVISSSLDGKCKLWCLLSGTLLHTLEFPCAIFSVVLDPTERELFAAGSDGSVYKASLRHKNKHLVSTSSELTPWASKHDEGSLRHKNKQFVSTNSQLTPWTPKHDGVSLRHKNKQLVSKSSEQTPWAPKHDEGSLRHKNKHIVSTSSDLTPWTPKHDGAVVSVTMINEGKNLVSAAEDGRIWVWEANKGQIIGAIENGIGSISDLVTARDRNRRKEWGFGVGSHWRAWEGESLRMSSGVLSQTIYQTGCVQEVLAMAAGDLKKAIDMLESAIEMYEKMLELILREAKASICCNEMENI